MSKTLCLDFDGVMHSYTSGWKGPDQIPDPPVPGMVEFCDRMLTAGWTLRIMSARAAHDGGEVAIRSWLRDNGFPPIPVVAHKPPAALYVDDRGFRFTGDVAELEAFIMSSDLEPWNRKQQDEVSPEAKVRNWKGSLGDLFRFLQLHWRWPDYFREVREEHSTNIVYELHTGGWSDHEALIMALQDNRLAWALCWQSSSRGGHHVFRVNPKDVLQ